MEESLVTENLITDESSSEEDEENGGDPTINEISE
jgi:hypothetical protein